MAYKVKKDFRIATSLTENRLLKQGDELTGLESYFNDLVKFGIVDEQKTEKKPAKKDDDPVKENKAINPVEENKAEKPVKETK